MAVFHFGKYKIEYKLSSTGSFSPWMSDIYDRYHISVMCTSDMAMFVRINDSEIYKVCQKFMDKLLLWNEMYNDFPEEVEAEIDSAISNPRENGMEYYGTIREAVEKSNLTAIYAFESISSSEERPSDNTIENAVNVFSLMTNYTRKLPKEDDVFADGNSIVFKWNFNGEAVYLISVTEDFVTIEKNCGEVILDKEKITGSHMLKDVLKSLLFRYKPNRIKTENNGQN